MSNPTLVTQRTPHTGWTFTEMQEELLRSYGLTLDSTTGRMVASTDETNAAKRYIKDALDALQESMPHLFSIVTYTLSAWTAGDHSVALPSDVGQVLAVRYNGLPCRPMTREDIERLRASDDAGGGLVIDVTGETGLYYRVTGFTSTNLMVLRLYPTPTDAKALTVDYVALAPALSTGGDTLPIWPVLQRWLGYRAKEFWCASWGDTTGQQAAERERSKAFAEIETRLEGSREVATRIRCALPNQASRRRRRYRS